jgi:hypothetical protein
MMKSKGMKTLAAALTLCALVAAAPLWAAIPSTGSLAFQVMRSDSDIGRHEVSFRQEGEDLHVTVEIELAVKLAFMTVFRYSHRNHEVWRDGKLVSIDTTTNDNGDEYKLTGRATDEGFVVQGDAGRIVAPAGIIPTSYWNPKTVEQTQLLDTQKGRLMEVKIESRGKESIQGSNGPIQAERFRVSGDLKLDLWYGPGETWSKIAFEARGAEVVYNLETPLQREASLDTSAN